MAFKSEREHLRAIGETAQSPKPRKAILFYSVSSLGDCQLLLDMGIKDILVSFYYLKKRYREYTEVILPEITARGGSFMIDSGAFSFLGVRAKDKDFLATMSTGKAWRPYLEEYVQYLHDQKQHIYCAANLDLDGQVGREQVDAWNVDYFEDLRKDMNMIFVAHPAGFVHEADPTGLHRLREYVQYYEYVGCSSDLLGRYENQIRVIVNSSKSRFHGFGWTSMKNLIQKPMFSVDSTTWMAGVRFGATFMFDGIQMVRIDGNTDLRKKFKADCDLLQIPMREVLDGRNVEKTNMFNIFQWLKFRERYYDVADKKLLYNAAKNYKAS